MKTPCKHQKKESAGKLVMPWSRDKSQTQRLPFLVWWWSLVKMGKGSADDAPRAGQREVTRIRCDATSHHLSVGRTSHRIWVAFLALKSSGVSSSTVSPLPFTPSSRSLLYSFYRTEEEQRDCRKGHTGRPRQGINTHSTIGKLLLALWAQSH